MKVNHTLRLGREVRQLGKKWVVRSFQTHSISREHLAKRNPAETHGALFEEVPPRFVLQAF
jgi:hypothetical protein